MKNLPATLSTLNQEISALTEKLAAVEPDNVAEAIGSLLAAGLKLSSGIQPDKAPLVYGYALSGVSAYGLRRAVTKLIRGEYDLRNRDFIPTPPEIAAIARAETRTVVEDVSRLKAKREAMTRPAIEKRDEGMIARVRALRLGFRNQIQASHATSSLQEPVSPEQASYYQKIMALKDAPDLDAEHVRYRNAVSKRIAGGVQP